MPFRGSLSSWPNVVSASREESVHRSAAVGAMSQCLAACQESADMYSGWVDAMANCYLLQAQVTRSAAGDNWPNVILCKPIKCT